MMPKLAANPATPKVERLYRYWLALARQAAGLPRVDTAAAVTAPVPAPPRSLINPAAIVNLLPNVMLVEFETDPFRVRYRLTGTLIDDASGINLTGSYLDAFNDGVNGQAFGPMLENYRHAWQTGEAVIDFYPWITRNKRTSMVCYGIFPLTIDGAIRQTISIEEYDPSQNTDPLLPRHLAGNRPQS